jgi:uncharacterized protein YciI
MTMNYYILTYKTTDNYLKEREKFRQEHLNHATEYFNEGYLQLGGALENPGNEALLLFKSDSEEIIEAFVKNDPYFKNGLIKSWTVIKWNVAIGN